MRSIKKWFRNRRDQWRYRNYTEEDWKQRAGEDQHDRMKDEGYFDTPYNSEV